MTDVVTPTDTIPSPTDAPAVEAPAAVEAAPPAPASEPDADATVLGGDVQDAPAADANADAALASLAPEKYELALEGVDLDPDLIGEAEPILRELNLTNEQANALLPLAPKIMEKAQAATIQQMIDAGAAQRKQWLDAFTADPEIGGARREETQHLAAKGLDALGYGADHPFRTALNESGFGNHPDMIRAFRRLGEMAGEDGHFVRSGAGESTQPAPLHERMYPNG